MFGWFKKKPKHMEPKPQEEVKIDDEEDKDIDPDQIALPDVPENKDKIITDVTNIDYPGYSEMNKDQMLETMLAFKSFPNDDDVRNEEGNVKGGRTCTNSQLVSLSRSVGKEIIMQIGKQILTGKFNLTKISFPIKIMIPRSALETAVHGTCLFPLYITKAAYSPDHLERFKLVIVSTLASFFWTNAFVKPLNPILGETFQANYQDGTEIYCEQISHHPPISYFFILGPNKIYSYFGYYLIEGRARLNSIQLINSGKRTICFKDGQSIVYDFPNEIFNGTLYGEFRTTSIGKMTFIDEDNNLTCTINLGNMKKKFTDYFEADIMHNDQKVCQVYGTYLGYINIDKERYWDYRYVQPYKIQVTESVLESDHLKRTDLISLKQRKIEQAQQEKERLEDSQRKDRKLREQIQKEKEKKKKKK